MTQPQATRAGGPRWWSAPVAAALAAAACLLGACGGAGDDEEQQRMDERGAEATPALAKESSADGSPAAAHFERLNAVRAAMGLPALRWNGSLAASANNHARYLVLNQATGHEEDPELPGFTGVSIAERIAAAGYRGSLVQETKAGGHSTSAEQGRTRMDDLLLAPLHRLQLLAPEYDDAGVGVADSGGPLVTNLGASGRNLRVSARRWMVPFNGQVGMAPVFLPGTEYGLPEGLPMQTGTPLTLSAFTFSMVSYKQTSLVEERTGEPVELLSMQKPGEFRAAVIFFPAQPLKADTAYVWRLTATVDRVQATTLSRFVTGRLPAAPVAPPPAA